MTKNENPDNLEISNEKSLGEKNSLGYNLYFKGIMYITKKFKKQKYKLKESRKINKSIRKINLKSNNKIDKTKLELIVKSLKGQQVR